MTNRRSFIKKSVAGLAAFSLLPDEVFAFQRKPNPIGLQLYTVRYSLEKDLRGTLEKIARIGYLHLEAAGYNNGRFYGLSPREFSYFVEDLGMKLISSHTSFNADNIDKITEDHLKAGIAYIVYPWLPEEKRGSIDHYKWLAEDLNNSGRITAQSGVKTAYHNHQFEFDGIDGELGYDILLENTDPELVSMELDLFWTVYAGYDPIDYFRKYPGRFQLWHIKDMDNMIDKQFTEVGTGIIDFKNIFREKTSAGMKYFFVEQDRCSLPEMESIAISFRNLQSKLQ